MAAARAAYIVTRDPADETRRLLLPAKNNLGDDRTGFAYTIEPTRLSNGIPTSRIVWGPDLVTVTADEALAGRAAEAAPRPRDMAAEWLSCVLDTGPRAVPEIEAEAKAAGLSWSTVRRAANQLRVTSEKMTFTGGWAWRLPEEAMPGEEIEL